MAIQDDFTIDVVDKKITYTTAFVDDRPPSIYTANAFYKYLQDTFDEPGFLQHAVPMSAQTPTQYTLVNKWFMDDESMKALYGGSIQTSGWTFALLGFDGLMVLVMLQLLETLVKYLLVVLVLLQVNCWRLILLGKLLGCEILMQISFKEMRLLLERV